MSYLIVKLLALKQLPEVKIDRELFFQPLEYRILSSSLGPSCQGLRGS